MADTFSPEQRHKCMSSIKGKNTKPEILVRKELFKRGLRFRINVKGLAGHPDIVLPKYKAAVFVNGCFWHGHENCKKATIPQTNTLFWREKIERNRQRDKMIIEDLRLDGWRVFVVWECELSRSRFEERMDNLYNDITSND